MSKMAILLAKDDWGKMDVFQAFFTKHSQAV